MKCRRVSFLEGKGTRLHVHSFVHNRGILPKVVFEAEGMDTLFFIVK